MTSNQNVLVTFAILSYNNEEYIAEALQSALAQTYSPLEIIVSDDCSKDASFDVIEEITRKYNGPHKVVINKNNVNLGLAANMNRVWELSSGEFLVSLGGDDIAMPNRTETLVKAWMSRTPRPDLVYSGFVEIDEHGKKMSEWSDVVTKPVPFIDSITGRRMFVAGGCSAAYSRDLHFRAGPMDKEILAEDFVYSFRALLGGGVLGLPEPLVYYRRHSASIIGAWKTGAYKSDRVLKAEIARLNEYKKALNAYGKNKPYYTFRLNRRIRTIEMQMKANAASGLGRVVLMAQALATGRPGLFKSVARLLVK